MDRLESPRKRRDVDVSVTKRLWHPSKSVPECGGPVGKRIRKNVTVGSTKVRIQKNRFQEKSPETTPEEYLYPSSAFGTSVKRGKIEWWVIKRWGLGGSRKEDRGPSHFNVLGKQTSRKSTLLLRGFTDTTGSWPCGKVPSFVLFPLSREKDQVGKRIW